MQIDNNIRDSINQGLGADLSASDGGSGPAGTDLSAAEAGLGVDQPSTNLPDMRNWLEKATDAVRKNENQLKNLAGFLAEDGAGSMDIGGIPVEKTEEGLDSAALMNGAYGSQLVQTNNSGLVDNVMKVGANMSAIQRATKG